MFAAKLKSDPFVEEDLLPISNQLWQWFPNVGEKGQKKWRNVPEISAMKKTLNGLNRNKSDQADHVLVGIIRNFWLRPPSLEEYKLENPDRKDFSKGQTPLVDEALGKKENGFFVECGALDGETRSNTLFFERERGWSGLLIEAGPINYRRLIKKNRRSYSTPACLGVKRHPTKMYFHRGQNRGRLIDGSAALEWVRQQAMQVWLMEVQCFPLFSLLLALNQTRVDYFSLDVEGLELEVLQTIPWELVDIHVMTVEFSHGGMGKEELRAFVEGKGYEVIAEVKRDDYLANDLVFKKINWAHS